MSTTAANFAKKKGLTRSNKHSIIGLPGRSVYYKNGMFGRIYYFIKPNTRNGNTMARLNRKYLVNKKMNNNRNRNRNRNKNNMQHI